MSEVKFTKGPWETALWNGEEWPEKRWSVSVNGECVCMCPRYANIEDTIHNAHLIACAPEMYEMLKSVIANYQEAASAAEQEGYATNYSEDAALVDSLLAKARGE